MSQETLEPFLPEILDEDLALAIVAYLMGPPRPFLQREFLKGLCQPLFFKKPGYAAYKDGLHCAPATNEPVSASRADGRKTDFCAIAHRP